MATDLEIGRVIAVDTAQVSIELNRDLKSMSRSTYEGPHEVGRINSFIVIPTAASRLIGVVTRVVLVEDAELMAGRTMVALPAARRVLKATLIGTINEDVFEQGVTLFPVLDSPVYLSSDTDLDAIFGPPNETRAPTPQSPKFIIPIGQSGINPNRPIRIDPDAFFGKHVAVLGSTGAGKSCTIASIIQSIHEQPDVKRSTFIIIDTNGEYRSAFSEFSGDESEKNAYARRCLYIPSDSSNRKERLTIPYWFMDVEDFVRLFQAAPGVQRPVLLEALRLARNDSGQSSPFEVLREELVWEFNRIWSLSGQEEKTSKGVRELAKGLRQRLTFDDLRDAWGDFETLYGFGQAKLTESLQRIESLADRHVEQGQYPTIIPSDTRKSIRDEIEPFYEKLTGQLLSPSIHMFDGSVDSPTYFDKYRFRSRHIEQVLQRESSGGPRARDYAGTMLLRIDRLLADRRFDFLFGPAGKELPNVEHVLAAFLRDIIGIGAVTNASKLLSDQEDVSEPLLPFYERQRNGAQAANVVILDLSLLAAEVLENVTALIGRLILDFLQRLGEDDGGQMRGTLPIVLVLEEAQNYIRQPYSSEEDSISRNVFERIAREGRKYGLGLVVASQRPSELSKTVLSQCNSFIVHRLQNPEDLRYFRDIVPGIYGPMLEQVPALAPRTALILGECVAAPTLVRIRDARPIPRSRDPEFYNYWTADEVPDVKVEDICAIWEGGTNREDKI
ncbi:MAG: DUF87 domain-containing protein [Candidatus Poribacteria bacterium]|nr:DUF87 domain-containing protein [Candidatus Poribacteria bacterium]